MEVLLITAAVSQVKLYLKCLSAESVYVYVVHQCRLLLTMDWINDIVTVCLSVTLAVCVYEHFCKSWGQIWFYVDCCWQWISPHFIGHFPGGPGFTGLIGAKDDGMVLITAAVSRAELQLKRHHQQNQHPKLLQAGWPSCRLNLCMLIVYVHQCWLLLTLDWINDIVKCLSVCLSVCVRVFMNISQKFEDRFGSDFLVQF